MLISLKNLNDFTIAASDGPIGHLTNCYFDDASWVTRYLVVKTDGTWFNRQSLLVSPISIRVVDIETRTIHLTLTREQLKHSPDIDTEKTVSRQHEIEYHKYYGYPTYWKALGIWGYGDHPYELNSEHALYDPTCAEGRQSSSDEVPDGSKTKAHHNDPHLRSTEEVLGYYIYATDGDIGHADDLLIDNESWSIRYLVVKTGHWWKETRVLIVPRAIKEVSWAKSVVTVAMTREGIKHAAQFSSIAKLNLSTLPD
ncbi:PRC-barrel domain-containing protein [Granulosicoccus antarcticus]|uniref:PRC-barrel domain-containing protein n=1 Tax=Granulosicoccus antarcticus IMCC3135 TaxID=1192854 RepID=A0A2Z2P2S4_9GAMM|nr:PRC-barrel domain-containing protein [Granulosicoccus antarcticus]ASJ75670.1 hypothetical protein IMCC3135_28090 [Granulosicoccus antarcticus IMCC3135]